MAGSHGYRALMTAHSLRRRLGRPRFLPPFSYWDVPILCAADIDSARGDFRGFSSLLRSRCLQTFSITAQAGGILCNRGVS